MSDETTEPCPICGCVGYHIDCDEPGDPTLPPLCTSVEPVSKAAMCGKDMGHPMPHRAQWSDPQGYTMTAEWHDRSVIQDFFKKMGV